MIRKAIEQKYRQKNANKNKKQQKAKSSHKRYVINAQKILQRILFVFNLTL